MWRSFIFGLFVGTLFGGLILASVSLLEEVPGQKPPKVVVETDTVQPGVQTTANSNVEANTTDPARPSTDVTVVEESSSQVGGSLENGATAPSLQPNPAVETSAFGVQLDNLVAGSQTQPSVSDTPLAPTGAVGLAQTDLDTGPQIDTQPVPSDVVLQQLRDARLERGEITPLIDFAVQHDGDSLKTDVSFLMLDDPASGLGPNDVLELHLPVTMVVNPTAPGAAARAQAFRDAGLEVAALTAISADTAPNDVADIVASTLGAVPQVVAVVPDTTNGYGSEAVKQTIAQVLAISGYGMVDYASNGNAGTQTSIVFGRESTPIVWIQRDLDANDQDNRAMRRFINSGVDLADNTNQPAVFLTRLRRESLTAIQLWGFSSTAREFDIAPISHVLQGR